jgi:hypothetical protein
MVYVPEAIVVGGRGLPWEREVPVTAKEPRLTSVFVWEPAAEQRKMSPAMVDVGGGDPPPQVERVRRVPE